MVASFLEQFGIVMDNGMKKISAVKAAQCLEESLPILRSIGDNVGAANFKSDMNKFADQYSARWAVIGIGIYELTLNDRLKALKLSTEKTIKNIITLGTRQNLSGKEIKEILRDYVNPQNVAEKPFDIARKALGASKTFRPKDVLSGSVQTNMYEITRNEASELWRDMTEEIYRNADWVEGYDWTLSASHPATDICDDLAEGSPYPKDEPRPNSHGHCLCDYVPHLKTKKEMMEILKNQVSLYNKNKEA